MNIQQTIINEECDQPPCSLKLTQEWFASVITSRLGENDTIQSYTPGGMLIEEEATRYVVASPTLRPHQRMQIYNQQYWWRLLSTMHTNFPLVARLFGSQAFNEEIGIPYLLKYPPNHWSLNVLGERLPKWITECYHAPDQTLVLNAANLDWAFAEGFIVHQQPLLDLAQLIQVDPESLLSYTFFLQPYIYLFKWEYDLFTFRNNFLQQDIDYWVEHRFPDLPKGKTFHFILFRNAKNNLSWREISPEEFLLLEQFKKGTSINDACEYIEAQDASLYENVAMHLQKWLQEWTQMGWLTLSDSEKSSAI